MTITEETRAGGEAGDRFISTSADEKPKPQFKSPKVVGVGFVLYLVGFGIDVNGIAPGLKVQVPSGAELFASAIGLIVIAAATTLDGKGVSLLAAMAVLAGVFFLITPEATGGDGEPAGSGTAQESQPYQVADRARLRAEPRVTTPGVDQLITDSSQPDLQIMGEHRTAKGWFRVQTERGDVGWMFGSLIGGLDHETYRTAEALNKQAPELVDAQGNPTGTDNPTGRFVLVIDEDGDLYEIIDPNGQTGYVFKEDFRLV